VSSGRNGFESEIVYIASMIRVSIDTVDYSIRIMRSEVDQMTISVKILAAILAAALNLILIVFVSIRNRRHIVYRSFLLISFCLLMWNLRVIISGLVHLDNTGSFYAMLVTQVFYPMVSACLYLLPVAALQFTVSFIGFESKLSRYLMGIAYAMAFFLSFLYVSELIPNWTNDRIFWAFFLPTFLVSLVLFAQAYLRSRRPLERARLSLLIIAGTIGVTGAITEDVLVASGINAGGLGNIANATYSLLVAICLFRHRLFDVSMTTRRAVSFTFASLILVALAYVTSAFLQLSTSMPYVHIFIAVMLLLLFGRSLIPFIEKIIFKKSTYIYQTIDSIRLTLDKAQNMGDLLKRTSDTMKQNLGVDQCDCVTFDDVTRRYQLYWSSGDETFVDRSGSLNNIITWMNRQGSAEPLIYDEMYHNLNFGVHDKTRDKTLVAIILEIGKMGYEVYLPLLADNRLEGIMLLSEKKNGRPFTDMDVRFMKLVAYNCTIWLQRLRMLERISQLEALAVLGEMAAYLAHELKNPLTIIRSSAQLMRSNQHDRENADMIVQECDRLSRVVTRMLDFSKPPNPNLQRIDIKKVIKQWIDDISQARQLDKSNIQIEIKKKVTDVVFDPDHLKQVVTNVVLNAIEAMREHGQLKIALLEDEDMVQLTISDSGPGIRCQDRTQIFKLFYSTKPAGTGLGLPISRRLLELNNGTIEIKSQTGKGCTVIIRLPRWRENP
jgi:signal transduction histidine kinase